MPSKKTNHNQSTQGVATGTESPKPYFALPASRIGQGGSRAFVIPETHEHQKAFSVAIYAYGAAFIFRRRLRPLKVRLMWLKFIGLAIPVLVGTLVLAFGQGEYLKYVLSIVGIVGAGQAVVSIWALASSWEESYAYAKESVRHNSRLVEQALEVAQSAHLEGIELKSRVDLLVHEHRFRSEQDEVQDLASIERRIALRVSLYQFQVACPGCKQIPDLSSHGNCSTCGI